MKKTKVIRFVESFMILPIAFMSSPGLMVAGNSPIVSNQASQIVSPQLNTDTAQILAFQEARREKAVAMETKADAIDAYFKSHDMPLEGMGMKMVQEAENNDLDWRLLPAIVARESTGGKFACKKVANNAFGWASCKVGFSSNEEAIETVARNLGGNNPKTAIHYGGDKTTKQILRAYNPPSVIPKYAEQVMSIMNTIGPEDTTPTANT